MNESTILDNEFLFNKIKDLESAAAPNPEYHPGATETSVETSDMDYSDYAFGFSLDPDGDNTAEVQINAGEIDRNTVAAAKIVVADDNFVYVRRTISNDTMLIATAASVPADDATYKYHRLYQFTVTSGVASLKLACRPFDIEGESAGGFTGDVTSVGAIQYSSNSLQYKVKTATYSNGLLTAEPTMGDWITLFTAVTGCPA